MRGMQTGDYISARSAVAASASAAPTPNAIDAPYMFQITPNTTLASERADAVHGVVDAERNAAARRRREVGDERLLGAFRETEVEAVHQKPRERAARARSSARSLHRPAA